MSAQQIPFEDLRVLVVEDNAHMASVLRAILQGFGVRTVMEAREAASALDLCRHEKPHIALVDYELGELTGLEFTRLVRTAEDSPNAKLPIILVTAHSERSRVFEAIDAGINEFVVKPVSATALYLRIRAVLDRPRPFIKTEDYFGPDRRRRDDISYRGEERRKTNAGMEEAQSDPEPDAQSPSPDDDFENIGDPPEADEAKEG